MKRTLPLVLGFLVTTGVGATDLSRVQIIGEEAFVRIETPHPVPLVGAGEQAWTRVFTWPNASYVAVHFERFDLAPGEKVVIHTPDHRYSYTFEGEGKPGLGGTFWATHVPGDTCVVTYYGNGQSAGFGYVVDKFAHGFPRSPKGLPQSTEEGGVETICGPDDSRWARCYESSEPVIYEKSRAIARLTINGVAACTGWLVGCEGHLMTNAHCITNPVDAMNTDYEFMAEGSTCETSCATFGGCPGIIETSTGTLIKTGTQAVLDYSFVLLSVNLSSEYGSFKLRPSGPVVNERIYLNGHPQAWGKRFVVESTEPSDESGYAEIYSLDEPPAPGCSAAGPPGIGYFAESQSGSSGSPVVAYSDHRVVSLHHCSGCPNRGVPIQNVIADIGVDLPACAVNQLDGLVEFTSAFFGCAGAASMVVRDDSLIGAGSQNVTISSSTETTPETVTLTESPPLSGTFSGSIPITTNPPTSGDGLLSVANGDTLTVVYIDADDGQGGTNVTRTDRAGVDCIAPVISDIAVSNITGDCATFSWTTNEAATTVVDYGTTLPPGSTASNSSLVTSHSLRVCGLASCTTYFARVRSLDGAGNVAVDDNGGSFHIFNTPNNRSLTPTSTDTPLTIPDNAPAGVSSTIQVADNVTVTDVNVEVNITHPFDGDLILSLITPSGQSILLSENRGSDGDNFVNTVFDDEASLSISEGAAPFTGSFRPETLLSAADGINAAGVWKLKVADVGPTDFGTLDSWTLTLQYAAPCGFAVAHQSHTVSDACSGTGTGGGDGIVDPGEDIILPLTVRSIGTTAATNPSAVLSTTTPGVTVTRSAATFPDMAEDATAPSDPPHYAVTIGTGVPCGTMVNLTLDAVADEGVSTSSFGLRLGSGGIATTTYESTDVPKDVIDLVTVTSTITVTDPSPVQDVDVKINVNHTWVEDLDIFLIGPDGTRVMLSTDNGGSGDNYTNTIFDDEADTPITAGSPPFTGRFRPEGLLSTLDGIPSNGTWTLEIRDDTPQDIGTLLEWSIVLTAGTAFTCNDCGITAPTGSTTPMLWSAGPKNSLTWSAVPGASFYNLYRGVPQDLPDLLDSSLDSCKRLTTVATVSGNMLTETPPLGSFYWYLARAANGAGEGPAGDALVGQTSLPRAQNSSGACP